MARVAFRRDVGVTPAALRRGYRNWLVEGPEPSASSADAPKVLEEPNRIRIARAGTSRRGRVQVEILVEFDAVGGWTSRRTIGLDGQVYLQELEIYRVEATPPGARLSAEIEVTASTAFQELALWFGRGRIRRERSAEVDAWIESLDD